MRTSMLLVTAVFLLPVAADAGVDDLVAVPGEAVFERADDEAALVSTGDGAALVACRALLIEGEEGLSVRASCAKEGSIVTIEGGGFTVYAGAVPVALALDGWVVKLARATLVGKRSARGWTVEVVSRREGQIALVEGEGETVRSPSDGEGGNTVTPPIDPRVEQPAPAVEEPIAPKVRRLDPEVAVSLAREDGEAASVRAIERPTRVRRGISKSAAARLQPRPIEDPADFAAARTDNDLTIGALEIDAIEVEVGCVEVCVD